MHTLSSKLNSRVAAFASAAILALGIVFPIIPIKAHAASLTVAPRVSFTFDDGLLSSYTQAAPTLAKYGFKGVLYTTSTCIGSVNTCPAEPTHQYMGWNEVNSLKNTYGWEIAAHTATHPLLASSDPDSQPNVLTTAQVAKELTDSRATIKANTGSDAMNFASPYGDWTPPVLANIAKYQASHRGFADSIDQNGDGTIDHANVFPYSDYLLYDLQVQAGVPVATVKSYIDKSIAANHWLILTFHDIQPVASTDPEQYQYNTADLDAIAAYVKSKNAQVVTIEEGLVTNAGNMLPGASFDTPLSTNTADMNSWSTDTPSNIKQDTANNGNYPSPANSVSLTGTTKNIHLFSPRVAVNPAKSYIIKNYLSVSAVTVAAGHEIAFYVEEYDAAGNLLTPLQYKKSETSVWTEYLNYEYKPSSATVASVRMQIVVTANSGIKAYLDNIQLFANDGSTTTTPGGVITTPTTPTPPVTTLKAGDVNGDGKITAVDLSILLSNWNKAAARAQGDLNADGKVTAVDLSILLSNWGK